MTALRRILILFWAVVAGVLNAPAQTSSQRSLIMISIDGMRPDYVTAADSHQLKIPNLRRILQQGAHAEGVRGVLPTVTYPSHTTLLTGVWPVKHGIPYNGVFDPLGKNMEGWYWYSEDIRVPTLWEAAAKQGYAVGSVSWPVSVGAPGVSYLIPEYWRAMTPDDVKLMHAMSTPGLMVEFEEKLGPWITDLNDALPGDLARTRYAEAIIRTKHPGFMTVHLAALDHFEHDSGPFSSKANATLEQIDSMVGLLERAMRDGNPQTAICIVSDHGFAGVDHQLDLNVAFIQAGLIIPNAARKSVRAPALTDWKAAAWPVGGSAFVMLKDPGDAATRKAVQELLRQLAADPANGIEKVLDREEIASLGGTSTAEFVVDMKPGFSTGIALDGPLVHQVAHSGTHGYSPTHPEMRASFFMAGPGVRAGLNLGDIDMRSIAPSLAKFLGASLPSADLPALDIFSSSR